MNRNITQRLVTIALLTLLAIGCASCISSPSGSGSDVLPTPSAVADPNPQAPSN